MPEEATIEINELTHPLYKDQYFDWVKWRIVYQGGRRFIDEYLEAYSTLEDSGEFRRRKKISYNPSFSESAIDDVKNSIFQRMCDITRDGGTNSYQEAIRGQVYGVDLLGSTMNYFMGCKVLPELLVMKKVGIYVDMPNLEQIQQKTLAGTTVLDRKLRPYLYIYPAEDIRSWQYDENYNPNEFQSLLLRKEEYVFDPVTRLPSGTREIYQHFYLENGTVWVQIYGEGENRKYVQQGPPIPLNLPRIPFVTLELSSSLMKNIADYQIALLNLESSDLSYALRMNYPFYTEQYDPRLEPMYQKGPENVYSVATGMQGTGQAIDIASGPATGRRYPVGTERPDFINPSTEPLAIAMEKEDQLKRDIRVLLNLTITNLQPRTQASAESKAADQGSLETGLSYIGLELENAERQVGTIWSLYEQQINAIPTVKYPEQYSLRSDADKRLDAQQLGELQVKIPSRTFQQAVAKKMAILLIGQNVSNETMQKINKEIDTAPTIAVPPDVLETDVTLGLVTKETASKIRGYPDGEVDKAKQEEADRLQRIAISQTQGAGKVPPPGGNGQSEGKGSGNPLLINQGNQSDRTGQ